MKISLRRRIREGERIPFGWAVAYLDWSSFVAYAYPVGLHVIVKVARRLYWMVIAFRPGKAEQQIRDARRSAYAEGVQEGRRQIRAIVEQRVQPELPGGSGRHREEVRGGSP